MPDFTVPAELLPTLLGVSLTALHLVRPVYGADGTTIEDFTLEYVSPAGQRMTGLPECPGGTLRTRFPHTLAAGIFDYYCRAFATDERLSYAVNYQAEGLDNYFRFQAQRHGEWLVVSFTDTADQDRSAVEQALRESQAREQAARAEAERQRGELQRVFAQAPVAIAIFRGPLYHIELVNDMHLALWGRSREQVLGRPLFEAIPEAAGVGYEELLQGVVSTGQPYVAHESSARLLRHGRWDDVYFHFVYQPLRESDGRISGVVVVATDVTEQVQARQQVDKFNQVLEARVQERTREVQALHLAAEQQHAYLDRLLQQAPIMINTQRGPEHVFERVHPLTYQLVGHRPLVGLTSRQALPELEGPFHELLDRVYHTGEPFRGLAVPGRLDRHGNGEPEDAYFDFTYQPIYDADGRIEGVVTFAVDVTQQVQGRQRERELHAQLAAANEALQAINQELTAANAQLTRTNRDLDTFVYTASHDLKAPILNIESLLQVLREHLSPVVQADEELAHLLELFEHTVRRFHKTITQLTDLSKLQLTPAGPVESVLLAEVLEDVRLDLAAQIQAAGTQLTVAVAPELRVSCAPQDLRSIVYNLLSNAIKYRAADRPSRVHVQAVPEADHVVLQVQDNGLGLTEAQQKRLFGLFQRMHSHVEGSGVGLYIVKRLVENVGGTITVQSQPGSGSTFVVALPG